MSIYFMSNLDNIKKEIGIDVLKSFLTPNSYLDAPIISIPFILKIKNNTFLLVRHIEKSNVESLNLNKIKPLYYNRYFLINEKSNKSIKNDLFDLLRSIFDDHPSSKEIYIDHNLPYLLYKNLISYFPDKKFVFKKEYSSNKKIYIYYTNIKNILNKFILLKKKGVNLAKRLIKNHTDAKLLEKYIDNRKDYRFHLLNYLLRENNITSIVIYSQLNFQQLTGISLTSNTNNTNNNSIALYNYNDEKVYILSEREIDKKSYLKKLYSCSSLSNAIKKITPRNAIIGFEEKFVDINNYERLKDFNLQESSNLLRKWREFRAGDDLIFYIIAGKATKYAMEYALEFAKIKLKTNIPITEKQIYQKYLEYFDKFKIENQVIFNFKEFFGSLYSFDRSIIPSMPTNKIINKETKGIKIDSGILLVDEEGLILSGTDLARILPLVPASKRGYKLIKDTVKKIINSYIKPGITFEDIYLSGVKIFSENYESKLKLIGLCPDSFRISSDYNRNIGHLMSQQESSEFEILKGNRNKIKENLIGCVEIQWQYNGFALAYEDQFFICKDKAINITY